MAVEKQDPQMSLLLLPASNKHSLSIYVYHFRVWLEGRTIATPGLFSPILIPPQFRGARSRAAASMWLNSDNHATLFRVLEAVSDNIVSQNDARCIMMVEHGDASTLCTITKRVRRRNVLPNFGMTI